jgi:hypothetical protein
MARPVGLDPKGGLVEVGGQILLPGPAPLKIDVWRRVRHPPPDLDYVASIKELRETREGLYPAGEPASLLGKVLTWQWVCSHLEHDPRGWRVLVDVRQAGRSVPGYPMEYAGPLPPDRPLAELRIIEPFVDISSSSES